MGAQAYARAGVLAVASLLVVASAIAVPARVARAADPAPTLTTIETRITDSIGDEYDPAISGNTIVYTSNRSANTDVYMYDLATGVETPVTALPGNQELSDVSGDLIAYTDLAKTDVMVYSMSDGTVIDLTATSNSISMNPAISGSIVAWEDRRDGNYEIYARDVATGEERRISDYAGQDLRPAVSGSTIAWERCASGMCDIYAYDWATGVTRQITDTPTAAEHRPDISGRRVVYDAVRNGEQDIFAFDLDTGVEVQLERPGVQANANVSGDVVAFEELDDAGVYHIGLWDLVSGASFIATSGPGAQYLNDIDGSRVAFTDDRNGQLDIYLLEFTITQPPSDTTPPVVTITSPANGATYLLGQVVTPAWTATDPDDASLTTSAPATVDTSTVGSHTYTVTAADTAGNATTASVTYTVPFASPGIAQPVNADGSSIFKGGSTVPLKFSLAGPDGQPMTGLAPRLYFAKISNSVLGDEMEAVSTSQATTGNVFRETSPGVYMFNLSTRGMAPGTYQVRIDLGSGASMKGQFSLK